MSAIWRKLHACTGRKCMTEANLACIRAVAKGPVGQVLAGPTFKHFSIKWGRGGHVIGVALHSGKATCYRLLVCDSECSWN